jgi:hypothetical protein
VALISHLALEVAHEVAHLGRGVGEEGRLQEEPAGLAGEAERIGPGLDTVEGREAAVTADVVNESSGRSASASEGGLSLGLFSY